MNEGTSLTPPISISKSTFIDVSTPPFAIPPLSIKLTDTVATPETFGIIVNVKLPDTSTAGCATNKPELVTFVTLNIND